MGCARCVQETARVWELYGLLQMDAKCENYLYGVDETSGVVVRAADYGGLCLEGTFSPSCSYPPSWAPLLREDAPRRGPQRRRDMLASECTCLAQFAAVLLQLMRAKDQVNSLKNKTAPELAAAALDAALGGALPLTAGQRTWLEYCSHRVRGRWESTDTTEAWYFRKSGAPLLRSTFEDALFLLDQLRAEAR